MRGAMGCFPTGIYPSKMVANPAPTLPVGMARNEICKARGGGGGRRPAATADIFRNGGDVVVIQAHGTAQRQGSAEHDCPGIHGDARVSENTAIKRRVCTDSRGGADLPKHVAGLSAIDEANRRRTGGRERGPNQEIEARIADALRVQNEYSGQ